ncbi:MAG: DedA family protein [Phycisphaerae bacterium]
MQEFFFQYIEQWSYFGLLVVLMAAGLGLPLPEDIPLLAAGWLVSEGHANLELMMLAGLVGVLAGDGLMFYMGRRYGSHLVEHRWFRRVLKPWLLESARRRFIDHGAKIVFVARFMPGLRAVMFVTAGIFRVPYWKFLTFDGTAALISVPLWIWVGSRFPGFIMRIAGPTRMIGYIVGGLVLATFVGFVVWEYVHNYRKRRMNGYTLSEDGAHSAPVVLPEADRVPPAMEDAESAASELRKEPAAVADEWTGC